MTEPRDSRLKRYWPQWVVLGCAIAAITAAWIGATIYAWEYTAWAAVAAYWCYQARERP